MLIGFGPSKAEIIQKNNYKIVRKIFPRSEEDRRNKEVSKLKILRNISTPKVFKVPEVLEVGKEKETPYYELEFIKDAKELTEVGRFFTSENLVNKLNNIIELVSSYEKPNGNIWNAMIEKFKLVKTNNQEYNDLISQLPLNINFNCIGYSHGDMSFDNILFSNGNFYLIDPAWSIVENPLWDVGKIMQSSLINWGGIKKTGKAIGNEREPWLSSLIYNEKVNDSILQSFIEKYGIEAVILSTACQLSRVSRWCFADVLIPIINNLLNLYLNGGLYNERIDALRRVI